MQGCGSRCLIILVNSIREPDKFISMAAQTPDRGLGPGRVGPEIASSIARVDRAMETDLGVLLFTGYLRRV